MKLKQYTSYMLQKNPTSLEIDSDSEDEKTSSIQSQKPQQNVTENNVNNQEEKTPNVAKSQTDVKTSNEGEDDGDEDDKSNCHCVNPSEYIDINQTKYYDATVIFSSFVNFALNIVILIHFYHNNQWAFFGVSLSFDIFSHLCYIVTVCFLYDINITDKITVVLFFAVLFLFSPLINLFMYLTSEDHLILTQFFKPTIEDNNWIDIKNNPSTWLDKQVKRLFGYVVFETLCFNIPQLIIQLVGIYDCIYNSNSNSNYNSSMIFYLFFAFYVNLFSIIVKSYVSVGWWFEFIFEEKSVTVLVAGMADFSTTVYLIIWMYVSMFFVFFSNFALTSNYNYSL